MRRLGCTTITSGTTTPGRGLTRSLTRLGWVGINTYSYVGGNPVVALLLAQGVSSEKIGERLHIKYTTVKDHVRKIFDKLDIHQREELLAKEKEQLI
jgi:Bacterial regulatory proteins, luxR family